MEKLSESKNQWSHTVNQSTHLESLLKSQWKLYSTVNNTTQSLFLWKNRLLSVCFTSILCYFSIMADLIFSQHVLNRFLHAVEISSQDDIQILSTTRGENDFLARQDCSSDIWLHLKCLVTVTNLFDWGIICQWLSTESSQSGVAFMTNSVKQHREDLKAPLDTCITTYLLLWAR